MKKNIAVLVGGYSSEYAISLQSGDQIVRSLDKKKYNVFIVQVTSIDWILKSDWVCDVPIDRHDFSFSYNGQKIKFDFAFIMIHGTPGENGWLQGYFEMINVPYSTAGVLEEAVSFDKYLSKIYLQQFGVPTAKSLLLLKGRDYNTKQIINEIGLPCFVKPNAAGSSYGISMVKEANEMDDAIRKAFNEDPNKILIEQYIKGTEVSCGIYQANGELHVMPPTEIVSENDYFDYDAKYNGKSKEITPARLSNKMTKLVQEQTKEIYKLFQVKGIVRVDFIIENDIPYFLEINTVPGMSAESIFPKQVKASGRNLTGILDEIIGELGR
jgi:D-alanine-D-alanine ligase